MKARFAQGQWDKLPDVMDRGDIDIDLALFDGATDAMEATELAPSKVDANLQDLPVWTFYSESFTKLRAIGPPVGRG